MWVYLNSTLRIQYRSLFLPGIYFHWWKLVGVLPLNQGWPLIAHLGSSHLSSNSGGSLPGTTDSPSSSFRQSSFSLDSGCNCLCYVNHGDMIATPQPFSAFGHDFPCDTTFPTGLNVASKGETSYDFYPSGVTLYSYAHRPDFGLEQFASCFKACFWIVIFSSFCTAFHMSQGIKDIGLYPFSSLVHR